MAYAEMRYSNDKRVLITNGLRCLDVFGPSGAAYAPEAPA